MNLGRAHIRSRVEVADGRVVAVVEIAASPERVFQALTSAEIVNWWVNPGVFDTRQWSGDVRVDGRWRASGIAGGVPYVLMGEYLEVAPPRRLSHTWRLIEPRVENSVVSFDLEPTAIGTLLTVTHTGLEAPEVGKGAAGGWETSLRELALRLSQPQRAAALTAKLPQVTSLAAESSSEARYDNHPIATVNDHVVRISVMTQPYPWHCHPNSDETFLVIEGRLEIEFEDGTLELGPGEMATVPRGVRHRTRPVGDRSVNLTFEAANAETVAV